MHENITFDKYEANTLWLALNDCITYHEKLAAELPVIAVMLRAQREPMQKLADRITERFGFAK